MNGMTVGIKRENNLAWKKYARLRKIGFVKEKQLYAILFNGKMLKCSVDIYKIIKWWNENYPTESLHIEVDDE